jgi:hypothetical protein
MTLANASRFLLLAFVCSAACETASTLTAPSGVTRVDVTGTNMRLVKRIDSPSDISAIVAFVSQNRDGWTQPMAGVPVARLYAYFYDGDRIAGHFGVGPGFFETDLAGDHFRSKDATKSECDTFLALIGMRGTQLK